MPGLLGFYDEACSVDKGKAVLKKMTALLHHQSFYKTDVVFARQGIYASRIHKNIIQRQVQPYEDSGTYVWLDGEIYNRASFGDQYAGVSDAEFLNALYHQKEGWSFLKDIDGIFSAVIVDEGTRKIHFITDRYGFRLLYYHQTKERLAWASETKAMLAFDDFGPSLNGEAVHHFFEKGYMLGNESLLQGVALFPPATVKTWDIFQKTFTDTQTYWSWDEIQTQEPAVKEKEIVEETGRLFRQAVERRSHPDGDVGVTLSGGLDSRAILAAMPQRNHPIPTYTFGKPGCWDIEIARKVARIKGAEHHIASLTAENWLDQRAHAVWWSDGQMNLMHMHILSLLPEMKAYFNINLNGFLGAAILGGYYLQTDGSALADKINNRGRRFINEGNRLGEVFAVFHRVPFVDNELASFVLSLPARIRRNSSLYNRMVLHEFPEFFEDLPWQRTGYPVSNAKFKNMMKYKIHALRNRALKILKRMGVSYRDNKHYHNYPEWIRSSAPFFEEILKNKKAIYPEFIDCKQVYDDWDAHLSGKDFSEKIGAYTTFEIYLQQLFEKKYRP